MADLYAKPSDFIETGYNPEQQQAGGVNKEVEEYLNSLPLEERDAARQRLMAPPTGEEIAMMVDQDETYLPTIEQFDEIEKWHKTKEVGIFDGLGTAAEMVFNEFGAAFGSATDKPLETAQKLPATVIEAFMQGTRAMYGMAAQSQNPDSAFFRVKDFLNGTGTREDRYNQYLEALDFNRKSKRLMEGKETLVMDKDLINPEVTQAMSYIADPSLFIPFGKVASAGARAVGMGEKLTLAAGRATAIKNKIIGGAIKWGAGQPLEFLGGAVRNTIDFGLEKAGDVFETATGMEAKEFARTARLSGIGVSAAGVAGHSIPYANAISDAYFTAGAGRGLGEALTAVGETMGKSPFDRGINSWAREALEQANKSGTPLSKQAQGLLKALDAVDPMFAYSYAVAEGAAQGMAIGGTLGYLSGGEEGLYQGMGAGLALGTMGAGAGKVVADVTGGTGVARRAVQAKMVIEGKKVTDPETATALQALQSAAESRGKDVDFVNGIIAGIDNLAPNTVLHALTVDQFKIEAVKQGYNPETGRFAETQNLVDLSEFGDNRQMRGRTTAFLRLLGGSFAGDADKLLRLSKDARFQTKLNERIKTQFNTLSEFEKDFVVRELKRQKSLIDSGKKKASDFRADYEAVSWGESWTAEIIKKYGTDAEGAKRDIKSILDDETVNGKLTRRGRVLKDRLRAEGFLSRNGDILSERNLHDADMTSGVFDKIKGAVVTREADGKTHLYLNLESFGDETFPHELFHAIFRDSPMKHQFVDSLAGKLLGVRDEKGNLIKEPEIAPSELKRFFKRYIEKTTYNQDGSFNREAADRMYKLVENGLAEYEATGDLKKISDSTRQLLNKYTEEFGAYYFSNWIMGKNRNYLFYGGELRGIAGIIDSVKENWLDFWQSKISSANPSFDFSNGVNEAFAKGGSVGRISAIDIWMRDMVRANANSLRGAFNPDTMSAENARQFYRSNGIRNIADSNGRPLQVNKQTAESRRLGREAFKILNGLDPTLRTTRTTLDTDGKQVITGKFSDAELDALVRGGIVPRAWADKVRQGYAMVDGTMPNVASFGYLGKTEQIGDYSWPRKTGKDVAFKNRKAIVFDVETKVRADGTFYTLFHTLDKAVIEQRGNDLWRNAEVRKLWNDDRGAMEADFFNYLNNASKPSTDSTKKDSAALLEKGDGLGAKRRDAMHQMAGMALQEGDSYRHKPMAEIPQGIRHSVTTFNVDGMTTLRIDKTERYNVDMNNAHKFIRENWQPEDMKQEKTPNGMAFTHASGFKFLRTDDGKVSVYTVVGNKVGTYNNLKEATQKAKSEYHKVYDNIEKSVRDIIEKQNKDTMSYQGLSADERAEAIESGDVFSVQSVKDFVGNRPLLRQTRDEYIYQRAFEAIKNPEELVAYAESVTRENLKVKAELEKLVKERERRSQILEEQKNAFADTHYAKLEELKKKHNYVTSWEQWKGVLREAGEWRPPSDSVNDYSKYLIEKQAQYEENAKKSWANLAADPEYIALMSNMDRWQESFVKPQVDSIIKFEEQIERFKVENQEALSDPVAVELYGNVMKYETLSRTDKADMFARIVENSARNRDYSGLLEALFAREYDNKIQTGKPFVAVTTHGTKSVELMVGRVYSEAALGSKHNIPSSNMGTFSAGSQNTSRFYAENAPTQDFSTLGVSKLVKNHSQKGAELVLSVENKLKDFFGRRYDIFRDEANKAAEAYGEHKAYYEQNPHLGNHLAFNEKGELLYNEWRTALARAGYGLSRDAFIASELRDFLKNGSTESWATQFAIDIHKITDYAVENNLLKSYPDKRMQVRSLIRMDNPYVVIDPRSYEEYRISPHMRRAIENGHDGIVFKRFEDGGQPDNVYVVFKGFADEQTKIIDTSWDDVGVPRGRDETGRVLKSGKELNLSFQPDEDRVFDFEPNSKKAAKLVNDYLYGLRTGKSHQDMITPELSYVLDNLEKFTKASNDDVVEAILKLGDRGGSVVNRLQNNEISLKQAVEEAKNIDEYTYLRKLKSIRDERKELYNAFMRATGQMRKISDKDGRRFNTHAERESKNTQWQPIDEESGKEYGGVHKAPSGEYGEGSLDAMDKTYPSDIYSSVGARYYGSGTPDLDNKAHKLIMNLRGKPDALVTVYRAVPKGVSSSINKGDWVTPLREYAVAHGERWEEGMTIIEKKVKASELYTEGNSLFEFGYSPKQEGKEPKFQPDEIPKEKGTTEIKAGYTRVYHQTTPDNIESIMRKGLLVSKSRPTSESRGVSVSETPFYGDNPNLVTIELQVPTEKLRQANGSALFEDVPASNIIAVHENWHDRARYILNNPETLKEVLNGDMDFMTGDGSPEAKAIEYIKKKYSKEQPKFQPDDYEGGRTYSEKEMAGKFIGRYAAENKGIDNGLKLFYGKVPAGMGALGLTLRDKKGEVVAHGQWQRIGDYVMDLDVKVDPKHQGKGYGNLLYSEAVERMRADGVEIVQGFIIDEKQRPVKIRQRIIDKENARIGSKKRTEMVEQIDDEAGIWESGLDKKAWYEPDDSKTLTRDEAFNRIYRGIARSKTSATRNIKQAYLNKWGISLSDYERFQQLTDAHYKLQQDMSDGKYQGIEREAYDDLKDLKQEIDDLEQNMTDAITSVQGDYAHRFLDQEEDIRSGLRSIDNIIDTISITVRRGRLNEVDKLTGNNRLDAVLFKELASGFGRQIQDGDVDIAEAFREYASIKYEREMLGKAFESELYSTETRTVPDKITGTRSEIYRKGILVDILKSENKINANGGAVGEVNPRRIINALRNRSGGNSKVYAEAKAIGLIDWLESKQEGKKQKKVTTEELLDFVEENKLGLEIDPELEQPADFGSTRPYVTGGEEQAGKGYRVYVVRMTNPKHEHGVEGHFRGAVVHVRVTLRKSNDGKKVMHIEEIQANNTASNVLSDTQRKVVTEEVSQLKKLKKEYETEFNRSNVEYQIIKDRHKNDTERDTFNVANKARIDRFNDIANKITDKYAESLYDLNPEYWQDRYTSIGNKTRDGYISALSKALKNSNFDMMISERETKLNAKKNNAPLQDQKEWVKVAFRTVLRKALVEGVDRITVTPWSETPIQVGMKKKSAERFYGKTIVDIFNSELQKMNSVLKASNESESIPRQRYNEAKLKTNEAIQNVSKAVVPSELTGTKSKELFELLHKDDADLATNHKLSALETRLEYLLKTIPDGTSGKWEITVAVQRRRNQFRDYLEMLDAQDKDAKHPSGLSVAASASRMSESEYLVDRSLGFDVTKEIRKVAGKPQRMLQPAEWSDFKTEQSPMGRIIKNAKGYSIMLINNKYRVYNPAKAIIGVYGNEEEAKRRVLRDAPKQ